MSIMPFTTRSGGPEEPGLLQRLFHGLSNRVAAAQERLVVRETLEELRELDEFMLRDIGATGDEIYRVHQLRNGQRPTLAVG